MGKANPKSESILWTRQDKAIMTELEENDRYLVKERYIRQRLDTCARIYLDAYRWLRQQAGKRMDIPPEARFPIWFSTSADSTLPLGEEHVLLKVSIPREQVMIFDMLKWDYIINYFYLPKDEEDRLRFQRKLAKYNIGVESNVYLENFYPRLKQEMVESWERLFADDIRLSDQDVAITWQIKADWIISTSSG
ncbi:MAG: DUF3841 domain-containing protein [Bacillota bacterium]